jgi:hypothetical protein
MSKGLKRLHELDVQIAESRARIVRQKQYIAELVRNDCNAVASKALLSEEECLLRLMTAQRTLVERSLRALTP